LLIPTTPTQLHDTLAMCVGRSAWCVVIADRRNMEAHEDRWYALAEGFDGTASEFVGAFGATLPAGTDALWVERTPDGKWAIRSPRNP
jgi:hypothetical protein